MWQIIGGFLGGFATAWICRSWWSPKKEAPAGAGEPLVRPWDLLERQRREMGEELTPVGAQSAGNGA
jgi:hypothetical protein